MKGESRNIFGWLGMRQEQAILEIATFHVEATYETVDSFKKAVESFIAGDAQAKKEAIDKVREYERKADELRSDIVKRLSEGILLPPDREDLMHFVKTLDRVADWTNGAARYLGFIEEKLPEAVMDNLSKATDTIFQSISKLKDAIDSLMKNDVKATIANCSEVDRFETLADDQKKASIESIIHAKMDGPLLLITYQLTEYMEGITDKIEDASDFIKVMAIKSQ